MRFSYQVSRFCPVVSTAFWPIALAVLALTAGSSIAALVAYDGFEGYTAGGNLNTGSLGSGWTGNWVTDSNHTTVQSASMADPNGTVNGGAQAARLQPTTNLGDVPNFMSRTFASVTSDFYVGFLIRNGGGLDNADFYSLQLSDGATGNSTAALGVGIRNAAGNPFFARVGSSSSGQTTNASRNATVDTTFLLVAKFSKDGSSNYNRVDLFINPGSSEPALADATALSSVTGLSSLGLFSVRNFSPEAGDTVFIDELRIGTTYADAIPEPSGIQLLMATALGFVFWRRRWHRVKAV